MLAARLPVMNCGHVGGNAAALCAIPKPPRPVTDREVAVRELTKVHDNLRPSTDTGARKLNRDGRADVETPQRILKGRPLLGRHVANDGIREWFVREKWPLSGTEGPS